jgi:hypothetical protein
MYCGIRCRPARTLWRCGVDESLYFANTRYLEDTLLRIVAGRPEVKHLVLIGSAINFIDASAMETLESLLHELRAAGVELHLGGYQRSGDGSTATCRIYRAPRCRTGLSERASGNAGARLRVAPLLIDGMHACQGDHGRSGVFLARWKRAHSCTPWGLCPSSPPTPFSHKGRRGSLGILMPETGDGMQGLPQKPAPVRTPPSPRACPLTEIYFGRPMSSPQPHAEINFGELFRAPRLPVDRNSFRSPIASADPCRNKFRRTLPRPAPAR